MKLLVIRLSALGDVAMTVPVIDTVARCYPQVEITMLSRSFMAPLFTGMPSNVHFLGMEMRRYGTFSGLLRLFLKLRKEGYVSVADLHDVLRTKLLRMMFQLDGLQVEHIDKGRKECRRLTRLHDKVLKQQPSSFQRYEQVFARLGLPVATHFRSIYGEGKGVSEEFAALTGGLPDGVCWIGFAPFAAHAGKVLPEATSRFLLRLLSAHPGQRIFLFGSGRGERYALERWATEYPRTTSVAGRLRLDGELALMSYLDVMVSMDSANMHLASLAGTPVVSVWGATHPYAGFMGWNQQAGNAIQIDLPCRPCSIFGNKSCHRGDYACLAGIRAEDIVQKVEHIVAAKRAQENP